VPRLPATEPCLTEREVHDLLAGTLEGARAIGSRTHIDQCDSCRELVAAAASSADSVKPDSIGRYTIERVAGAGAMGIVYEAIDPQLGRRVAIKLLRHERGGDADRLLREARAVAQISHPNVIAVYDSGVADGEVFMVMELIRGITLREWLGQRARPWWEIIDVAIRAGRGIAAVHAAGLVHRDIKPDNILVASDGRILLTDFGLVFVETSQSATLAGNVDLTQTGAVVGTPAYLAPEVLDGEPATASADQFSYCVSLWEALAGERPYLGATLAALREAIDNGPGVLTARGLPRSIAGAIARGLAVSPSARWPSLEALLDELERGLRSHRHTRWIAAGAVALCVAGVTGGLAVSALGSSADTPSCDAGAQELASVWSADIRDRIGAAFARTQVPYAVSTWQALAIVIDDYGKRWVTSYNAACAATHIKHTQSATTLDLRTRCLEQRRGELAATLDVFSAPAAAQIDSAPRSCAALVSPAVCDDVVTLAEVVPMPDALDIRAHVAAAQQTLARAAALYRAGKYQQALELAGGVIAVAERIGYPPLVAEAHVDRANYATALERWDLAKPSLDAALLAAERARDHRTRSDVHLRLAVVALHHDDQKTALVELDRGDAILAGIGAAVRQRAIFADVRGTALGDMGKLPEAVETLERAARLYAEASGPTSLDVAGPMKKLGYIEAQRGDMAVAIKKLERVLAIRIAAQGPDHPEVGITYTDLAFMLRDERRYPEAVKMAEAARANLARTMPDSPEYWEATRSLVGIHRRQGDYAAAEKIAREVLAALEQKSPNDQRTADAIDDLAQTLTHTKGAAAEVLALRKRALDIRFATHAEATHSSVVMAKLALADATAEVGKFADALALYDELLPLGDQPDRPPYLAPAIRLGRGRCLVELHRYADAVRVFERVLAIADPQQVDPSMPATARFGLAMARWGTGEKAAAKAAAAQAKAEAVEIHADELIAGIDDWLAKHP
jgi:eukaryotic-like serine/threonine-protein kinase